MSYFEDLNHFFAANMLQVEGQSEVSNELKDLPTSDQMFRMSPDKEWKPNVQQKMIFNGNYGTNI